MFAKLGTGGSVGVDHTCAVSAQGQLPCFGWNAYGQCDVPEDLGMVAAVAAGGGHTCAVTAQGRLLCFEWNAYGQCDVPEEIPVRLEGVSKGFRLDRPFAGSLRKQPVSWSKATRQLSVCAPGRRQNCRG